MTRAILCTGVGAVLCSLWPVDDGPTVCVEVYSRALTGGAKRTETVGEAQAALRRDPRWDHTFYWATFALWGQPG